MDKFVLQLYREIKPILDDNGVWEQLLRHSQHNTIFMTPGWLKAAWLNFDHASELWIAVIYQNEQAIAAGAFLNRSGVVEFLGTGSADYLDFLFHHDLTMRQQKNCLQQILQGLSQAIQPFKSFYLKNIITRFQTPQYLQALNPQYHMILLREEVAPFLTMDEAPQALKKKSLHRHENLLKKQGELTYETVSNEQTILKRLEILFDQHQRRWQKTPFPSLFNFPENKQFYRELTHQLAPRGWLRYTEVRLNETVIACHFGTLYNGIFTWYKPSFEPQMAAYSPGEVLLKALISQAMIENAQVFDFTVGAEAFKFRFANQTFNLVDLYVTNSWLRYRCVKDKILLKNSLRAILAAIRLLPWMDRLKHNGNC